MLMEGTDFSWKCCPVEEPYVYFSANWSNSLIRGLESSLMGMGRIFVYSNTQGGVTMG